MKPVAACLLLLAVPLAAGASPVVTFETSAVVAGGLTPKGQVVWFSVAREISRQATSVVPRIELGKDDDGDGTVRLDLDEDVPLRSIWFAVDLATGEAGVAAPEGFPLLEKEANRSPAPSNTPATGAICATAPCRPPRAL